MIALVQLLSSVGKHMPFQGTPFFEGSVAHFTLEWLIPCVLAGGESDRFFG